MSRLWKSQRGSASVFLMLIVAPMFVFHAVLIDFIRIRMAERESESSLRTALRSTMSAYDSSLREYGLYALGLDDDEAEQLFREVLSRNLNASGSREILNLVHPVAEADSVHLAALYTLGNQTIFRQQLLEEMKYRAPAEFTVNVLDKLMGGKNTTAALTGASAFEKHAEEIEEWVKKREQALDAAWDALLQLQEKTDIYQSYFTVRLAELDGLASQIGVHDVAEIEQSLHTLRNQSEQIQQSLILQQSTLQELVKQAKADIQLIRDIQNTIGVLQNSLSALASQISQWQTILRVIAEFSLLMEVTKGEAARDANVLMSLQQTVMARIDEAQQCDNQIRTVASSSDSSLFMSSELIEQTVKPASYYASYKVDASSATALFNGFYGALQATTPFVGDNRWTPERYRTLSASNTAYAARASDAVSNRQAEEVKRQQASQAARGQRDEQLGRMYEVVDQIKKLVAECGGITGGAAIYDKLETGNPHDGSPSLSAKYVNYNRITGLVDGKDPSSAANISLDGGEVRSGAFRMIDSFVPMLASAARSFRDELYVNEYALEKFNYRTFGKELDADGQAARSTAITNPGQHALRNQEVEYILYGHASCMMNQSSAYAEMFAFRLAIRMTEALLNPGGKLASIGSPLLLVLWAAAEGAVQAYRDMTELVNGKAIAVSEKLAGGTVTMNYKDYMRIFYLLHSNNKMSMARMQALIEVDTGLDLTHKNTYLHGSVTSSERLWFFPYFESLFAYEVKRNRAYMQQTAFLSY